MEWRGTSLIDEGFRWHGRGRIGATAVRFNTIRARWWYLARASGHPQRFSTSLLHARIVIETWRREYNEERPKKALGGLTPAQCAKQLTDKATTVMPGL